MTMNNHVLLCTMMPILGFPHRPMFVPALVYVVWCFMLISKKWHRCKWTWETIIFFMKTQIKVKEQCFIQFFNKTFLSYETCVISNCLLNNKICLRLNKEHSPIAHILKWVWNRLACSWTILFNGTYLC